MPKIWFRMETQTICLSTVHFYQNIWILFRNPVPLIIFWGKAQYPERETIYLLSLFSTSLPTDRRQLRIFELLRSPRIDSKEPIPPSCVLCSLAGRYDSPIPTRFLALIDYLKIPAQLISNAERFKPSFAERAKKKTIKDLRGISTNWFKNRFLGYGLRRRVRGNNRFLSHVKQSRWDALPLLRLLRIILKTIFWSVHGDLSVTLNCTVHCSWLKNIHLFVFFKSCVSIGGWKRSLLGVEKGVKYIRHKNGWCAICDICNSCIKSWTQRL